jgi:hypothetical protein
MERPICLFRLDFPVPCLFTAGFPYFTWGLSLLGISVLVGKHGTAMTIIYEQGDRNGVPRYTVHEFEKKQEAYQVPWAPSVHGFHMFSNVEWKVMGQRRGLKVPEGERFRRSRLATGTACWCPGLDWTAMADARFAHEWIMFPSPNLP